MQGTKIGGGTITFEGICNITFKLTPITGFTSLVGFKELNKNIGPKTIIRTPKNVEAPNSSF